MPKQKGWIPRFEEFIDRNSKGEYVYTPGYEKLLIDFKLFDKKGRILPQEPVKPVFDGEFLRKILDDYVEGEKVQMDYDGLYEAVKEDLGLGEAGEQAKFSIEEGEDYVGMARRVVEGQVRFNLGYELSGKIEEEKKRYNEMIDAVFTDAAAARSKYNGDYFVISDLPEILRGCGFADGVFEIPFKSVKSHLGKSDHLNSPEEWKKLPEALRKPFLVTRYGKNGLRIYSHMTTENGKNIVVGVDVKRINQGKNKPLLEINSVKTAFENNGLISPNEDIVGYDKNITPEEQALLNGLNYQAYPTLQELSEGKGIDFSQEKQELSPESAKAVEGVEGGEQVRFSILGEKGAGSLDASDREAGRREAATRMDDLAMAREMETRFNEIEGSEEHKRMVEAAEKVRGLKAVTEKDLDESLRGIDTSSMSREDLKRLYQSHKKATNKSTGTEVEFFGSAFEKNHREGGLFEKAIPGLKAAFEDAILIGSESDNRAGEKRPDGTVHKKHPSVQSFDDYVGKIDIEGKEYYVRYTVQMQKGQNGIHSQFISNIDLYDATNPTNSLSYRDSSLAARGTVDGIVDAKLRNFFMLASDNPLTFAKRLKYATGWERGADGKWRYEVPDGKLKDDAFDTKAYAQWKAKVDRLYGTENTPGLVSRDCYGKYVSTTNEIYKTLSGDELWEAIGLVEELYPDFELKAPLSKRDILKLGDLWNDESLFRAYPQLSNMPVENRGDLDGYGIYTTEYGFPHIVLNVDKINKSGKSLREVMVHEIQHAIQEIEGFAVGGNANNADYDKLAGEVEARNVSTRMGFSEGERREKLLSETEDVAREDQVFLRENLGEQASMDGMKGDGRGVEAKREMAVEMGEKLGCKVRVIEGEDYEFENEDDARSKGWYDTETGEVVIVLGNNVDVDDVERTALHEIVAHRGLRRLFGKGFDSFLDRVYRSVPAEARERITEMARRNGWDFRTATEEYLASLAESTDFERMSEKSWMRRAWDKVREAFGDMLAKVGINIGSMGDNELRYQLWRSYKMAVNEGMRGVDLRGDASEHSEVMERGDGRESVLEKAEDVAMQQRLGVSRLHRMPDPVVRDSIAARDRYEKRMRSGFYQAQEALQDSMLSLKEAMMGIIGGNVKYIEDVDGYENPYLGENFLSSVNETESDAVKKLLIDPMLDAAAKLANSKAERKALNDYLIAKHGLERNVKLAERDAERELVGSDVEKDLRAAERALAADPTNVALQNAYNNAYTLYMDAYNKLVGENRERDYSGLTALTGKEDLVEAELDAQAMVSAYEGAHDTTELWASIKAVSDAQIDKACECGLISEETRDKIKGMFENYVPLRGFDEKTSDEVYAYLNRSGDNTFNSVLKGAKGRTSKADDPLSNLVQMHDSVIAQGNRNTLVKQRLLNFVLNHPSDLFSVSELWLQHDDITDEWVPVFPDNINADDDGATVEQKMKDFEERMEQLKAADPDKYKHGKECADVPYRIVGEANKRQHMVVVKRNGQDIIITVNGNPRVAQAMNGITNPDNNTLSAVSTVIDAVGDVNRTLSALYTTLQPDFVVSNFLRDTLYSNSMVWIKESPGYAAAFNINYMRLPVIKSLLQLHRKGKLDMSNATHRYFAEFMANGGETGYKRMADIDVHRKMVDRYLKDANTKIPLRKVRKMLAEWIGEVGRGIEMRSRFVAYVTSRQKGRTIDRSIWDAKEISVNFNKKGAGDRFIGQTGQTRLGNAAAFTSGMGRATDENCQPNQMWHGQMAGLSVG